MIDFSIPKSFWKNIKKIYVFNLLLSCKKEPKENSQKERQQQQANNKEKPDESFH